MDGAAAPAKNPKWGAVKPPGAKTREEDELAMGVPVGSMAGAGAAVPAPPVAVGVALAQGADILPAPMGSTPAPVPSFPAAEAVGAGAGHAPVVGTTVGATVDPKLSTLYEELAKRRSDLLVVKNQVDHLRAQVEAYIPVETSEDREKRFSHTYPRICVCGEAFRQSKWGAVGECDNCSGIKFCTSTCYGNDRYCGGCGGKFLPRDLRFWEPSFDPKKARKYWSDQKWQRMVILGKEIHDFAVRTFIATGSPAVGAAGLKSYCSRAEFPQGQLTNAIAVGVTVPDESHNELGTYLDDAMNRILPDIHGACRTRAFVTTRAQRSLALKGSVASRAPLQWVQEGMAPAKFLSKPLDSVPNASNRSVNKKKPRAAAPAPAVPVATVPPVTKTGAKQEGV